MSRIELNTKTPICSMEASKEKESQGHKFHTGHNGSNLYFGEYTETRDLDVQLIHS